MNVADRFSEYELREQDLCHAGLKLLPDGAEQCAQGAVYLFFPPAQDEAPPKVSFLTNQTKLSLLALLGQEAVRFFEELVFHLVFVGRGEDQLFIARLHRLKQQL